LRLAAQHDEVSTIDNVSHPEQAATAAVSTDAGSIQQSAP
jgi:hypothetical protein